MVITPDTHELWPEADDAGARALREAVSVALGLIISFTPHEAERASAFNTLVAAHKRALAARSIGQDRLNYRAGSAQLRRRNQNGQAEHATGKNF